MTCTAKIIIVSKFNQVDIFTAIYIFSSVLS